MSRFHVPIAAVVAAAAGAAPAPATHDTLGFSCGLTAVRDLLDPAGTRRIGEIDGGPWLSTDRSVRFVTITCTVQLDSSTPGSGVVFRAESVTSGTAGVLAQTVSYDAPGSATVFLCSRFEWFSTQHGPGSYDFDADAATPGVQCPAAT